MEKIEPKLGINRRSFRIWGSKGGKIGGKANIAKNGKERMKIIGSLGGKAKKTALQKSVYKYLHEGTDIMK